MTADFQGIWSGMIGGTAVQTIILAYLTVKCDWDEEVAHCTLVFFVSSVSAYIFEFLPCTDRIDLFVACDASLFAGEVNQYENEEMG